MTGLNIPNFASQKERPVLPNPTFQKNSKPRQKTSLPEEREPLIKAIPATVKENSDQGGSS